MLALLVVEASVGWVLGSGCAWVGCALRCNGKGLTWLMLLWMWSGWVRGRYVNAVRLWVCVAGLQVVVGKTKVARSWVVGEGSKVLTATTGKARAHVRLLSLHVSGPKGLPHHPEQTRRILTPTRACEHLLRQSVRQPHTSLRRRRGRE